MSSSWWIWAIGGALLLTAGFGTAVLPRLRARELVRRTAAEHARRADRLWRAAVDG
jgi:hypothetical protein